MTRPCPLTFHKGGTWAEVPFYKSIICNFMVYQDAIETNLLQLLAHTETSECFFCINSGISFELNIIGEKKQAS